MPSGTLELDARLFDMTHTERVEHLLLACACALTQRRTWEIAPWIPDPMDVFK